MSANARPLVMGVLNVTPDSFSDGGHFLDHDRAVERGLAMVAAGAQIIDVGGESTRPGATRIGAAEEISRILPVVRELLQSGVLVSVDTMTAETARAVADEGVQFINDVSSGAADPRMLAVVADSDSTFIAGHWRGLLDAADSGARYRDPLAEVTAELGIRRGVLNEAGIPDARIVLDPGLGFSKNSEHNWALLRGVDALIGLGLPLLIGASRKRFLGSLLPVDATMEDRDLPTAVLSALLADAGVWGFRVHNPEASARALDVWEALRGRSLS